MKAKGKRKFLADIFGTAAKYTLTAGTISTLIVEDGHINFKLITPLLIVVIITTVLGFVIHPKE